MANIPFLPPFGAKKLRYSEKKNAPVVYPAREFRFSIDAAQNAANLIGIAVKIPEPVFGCQMVMRAGENPLLGEPEVVREISEQMIRGHNTTGKKVP